MAVNVTKITDFLHSYGKALAAGDAPAIAACYGLPALVLHDGAATAASSRADLLASFRGLGERYRTAGLYSADPDVTGVELLGAEVMSVDVTWHSNDADGARTSRTDRYRYLIRDTGERLQIHVVVQRG